MAIKPITETLLKIAGGELVAKASEQLNEVVNAVDNLGGSGTVTIKLTINRPRRESSWSTENRPLPNRKIRWTP